MPCSTCTTPRPRPAPGAKRKSPAEGADETVFKHVSELAAHLGLTPPSYRIEPEEMHSFFGRRAVFAHDSIVVPPGVAIVTGVLGKKQAKLQVADKVLKWLREELRRRGDVQRLVCCEEVARMDTGRRRRHAVPVGIAIMHVMSVKKRDRADAPAPPAPWPAEEACP